MAKDSALARHSACTSHRIALSLMMNEPIAKEGMTCIGAAVVPCSESFVTLRDAIRSGKACGKAGLPGVGGYAKLRKMGYCMGEAYRAIGRSYMEDVEVISIHQDARAGHLLLRARACNTALDARWLVLGQANLARDHGCSAEGIKDTWPRGETYGLNARTPCKERFGRISRGYWELVWAGAWERRVAKAQLLNNNVHTQCLGLKLWFEGCVFMSSVRPRPYP